MVWAPLPTSRTGQAASLFDGRILLLLAHPENRRLLADWLGRRYEVRALDRPETLEELFDLCVIDGPMLEQLKPWVQAVRRAEHPVLLPFLLLTHRQGVLTATADTWEHVDDVIVTPAEKLELRARVGSLLRARRLSLENAALARRLEAELARAAAVQAELLPDVPPAIPGFELAARCIPAHETGGDFYDWQPRDDQGLSLQLGDVMGKGMPAALLMATARATLRAVIAAGHPPGKALDLLRQVLGPDLLRTASFVTVFHAQVDTASRRVRHAAAGHGHAFVRRTSGAVERLDRIDPPIGAPVGKSCSEGQLELSPGDALVVYTDGLLEMLPASERYPAALARSLDACDSAEAMVHRLLTLVSREDPAPDDLTVMVLRCASH
jgi:serine phosphatase RsbU (regulator of sigma subunit)